ncbi:hypothetical protein [Lysobacter enzymogenes]|uniref:hypothetical protein n=1 Tax=Lysobacter enzymogenes TaxID=69 RepID=UPI002263FC5A|nr:hypothetical protein [Lysobacter enzymogenes]UZW60646.1 hypothetical protein BV903_025925 [Lysobacter enzymogenes]
MPAPKRKTLDLSLPPKEHFRDCYYFIQEIIQLMESVYNDLELERNWNHPDNRGWMNQFRHWTWVPMFRLVWSLTVQSRSGRFVQFCEARLDVPKMAQAQFMRVAWQKPNPDKAVPLAQRLKLQSKELYEQGRINQLGPAYCVRPPSRRP